MNAPPAFVDWIRPWYPAGAVAHTRTDCPRLLAKNPHPREGAGWLNPHRGDVCEPCLKADGCPLWDAVCNTCDYSLREATREDEADDVSAVWVTQQEAIAWKRDHRCVPCVSLISPMPPAAPQPLNQQPLFALGGP